MKTSELIEKLKSQKIVLISYLESKIHDEDWHAIADAAMDLREVDAKLTVLKLGEL